MKHFKLFQFLIIFFIFISHLSYAQVKVGIKGGYGLEKLRNSSENIYTEEYESKGGMDWGFIVEIPLTKLISIQPELNFSQRGGVRDGSQPVPTTPLAEAFSEVDFSLEQLNQLIFFDGGKPVSDANPFYADYKSELDLKYMEIPVLVKFGWGSNWRFFVEAGPNLGILINSVQVTSGGSNLYYDKGLTDPLKMPNPQFDGMNGQPPFLDVNFPEIPFENETDIEGDLETLSVGLEVGVGLIKVFGHNEIFINLRTLYGLSYIQRQSVFGQSNLGGIIFSGS